MKWRKSSLSGSGSQDACVELASTLGHLRDSKNENGPVLRGDMTALVRAVKSGRLSR